jgi:hypothetical protein
MVSSVSCSFAFSSFLPVGYSNKFLERLDLFVLMFYFKLREAPLYVFLGFPIKKAHSGYHM